MMVVLVGVEWLVLTRLVVVTHKLLLLLHDVLQMSLLSLLLLLLRPVFSVEKGLGKRVVLNLQARNLVVLVCRDCDELRGGEMKCVVFAVDCAAVAAPAPAVNANNVDAGLVLVEGVEHDLALTVAFVGELDFGEVDGLLGPVTAVVGRVGMGVHRVAGRGLGFATWNDRFVLMTDGVELTQIGERTV